MMPVKLQMTDTAGGNAQCGSLLRHRTAVTAGQRRRTMAVNTATETEMRLSEAVSQEAREGNQQAQRCCTHRTCVSGLVLALMEAMRDWNLGPWSLHTRMRHNEVTAQWEAKRLFKGYDS